MPVPRSTCQRPATSSAGAAAQVVGDAVQVGAAIAQQATGGDSDDAQPGLLDDIIGVAALRELTADMGVQRLVVGRAQLRDILRFDRRGHGAGDNWEGNSPRRQGQRLHLTAKENHLHPWTRGAACVADCEVSADESRSGSAGLRWGCDAARNRSAGGCASPGRSLRHGGRCDAAASAAG